MPPVHRLLTFDTTLRPHAEPRASARGFSVKTGVARSCQDDKKGGWEEEVGVPSWTALADFCHFPT